MLQHIYPEQITSNVTYSLIGKRAIAGKRLHDLSSYTVIIIADELENEMLIKNILLIGLFTGPINASDQEKQGYE